MYIRNGHLKTDLHVKPTDTHRYFHINSCHPRHCKTAIPYSVALRVRRICSDEEDLSKRMEDLKQHLRRRGYPEHLLTSEIQRATNTTRDATLRHHTRDKTTRIPLVVTYTQLSPPWARSSEHTTTSFGPPIDSKGSSITTHHRLPSSEELEGSACSCRDQASDTWSTGQFPMWCI